MYSNPEIEKLRAKQKQGQKKLEQLQHREQKLQNRIRYLEGTERRQRSHRLITRGAAVEHLWPEVKDLSEKDFFSLMERILSLDAARNTWMPLETSFIPSFDPGHGTMTANGPVSFPC